MFLTGHRTDRPLGAVNVHSTLPVPLLVTDLASTVNSVGLSRKTPMKIKRKSQNCSSIIKRKKHNMIKASHCHAPNTQKKH